MARPSLALFLVTAGLMATTAGCAKPEASGGEEGEGSPTMSAPTPAPASGAMPQKEGADGEHGDEGGEGGEGGEG